VMPFAGRRGVRRMAGAGLSWILHGSAVCGLPPAGLILTWLVERASGQGGHHFFGFRILDTDLALRFAVGFGDPPVMLPTRSLVAREANAGAGAVTPRLDAS